MKLDYSDVQPGKRYKLTGNTFAHRDTLAAIGASWQGKKVNGIYRESTKYYLLDLTGVSKTAYGKISGNIFKLSRGGVIIEEER